MKNNNLIIKIDKLLKKNRNYLGISYENYKGANEYTIAESIDMNLLSSGEKMSKYYQDFQSKIEELLRDNNIEYKFINCGIGIFMYFKPKNNMQIFGVEYTFELVKPRNTKNFL